MKYGWSTRLAGFVPAGLVAACLATPAADGPQGAGPSEAETASLEANAAAPIDWSQGDCLSQLRTLQQAVSDGRLGPDDRPPFAVELVPPSAAWLEAVPDVPIEADLPLMVDDAPSAGDPRCVLRIGPARDQSAEHRTVDIQDVRSAYQSSVRHERNPDYDLAQLKHRQAKDDARGGQRIVHVGDPLLDLIGTTVGGVIGTLDRRSRQQGIDDAAAELAATPRSLDRPVYRPYSFERMVVRAQKQAVVPVALLERGRPLRRAELRQRERREFFVLRGLDPRDRDYEQQRSSSMTRADLARWTRTPPALRLSSVAMALTESPSEAGLTELAPAAGPAAREPTGGPPAGPSEAADGWAIDPAGPSHTADEWASDPAGIEAEGGLWWDGSAFADDVRDGARVDEVAADEMTDPSLEDWDDAKREPIRRSAPEPEQVGAGFDLAGLSSGAALDGVPAPNATPLEVHDPHAASIVAVRAGRSGLGFYVREDMVLTSYQVVGATSVVDVTTADGATVPALVAGVDPARDLALLQVPRPGPALALYQGGALAAGRLAGAADPPGRPLFANDQVVGMATGAAGGHGDVVSVDAIRAFLDSQAGLLAAVP